MKRFKRPFYHRWLEWNLHHLYKYRPCTPHTFSLLRERHWFFSDPPSFNDPFDCRSVTIYRGNFEKWMEFLSVLPLTDTQRESIARRNENRDVSEEEMDLSAATVGINRIYCLCRNFRNIAMWSHYAANHTGICIRFRVYNDHGNFGVPILPGQIQNLPAHLQMFLPLFRVRYQRRMPKPYLRWQDDSSYINTFFVTKHSSWTYEQEYRSILLAQYMVSNPLRLTPDGIDQVLLGARISSADRQTILDIAQADYWQHGIPLRIFQARPSINEYRLLFEDITPSTAPQDVA